LLKVGRWRIPRVARSAAMIKRTTRSTCVLIRAYIGKVKSIVYAALEFWGTFSFRVTVACCCTFTQARPPLGKSLVLSTMLEINVIDITNLTRRWTVPNKWVHKQYRSHGKCNLPRGCKRSYIRTLLLSSWIIYQVINHGYDMQTKVCDTFVSILYQLRRDCDHVFCCLPPHNVILFFSDSQYKEMGSVSCK